MLTARVVPLPYSRDSMDYYALIRGLGDPVWLDSCHPYSERGRYDILSARPRATLQTFGEFTHWQEGKDGGVSRDDPFALVERFMPEPATPAIADGEALPFCGGAIGYFGYDLARRIEKLPTLAKADLTLPDLWIGLYDWAIVLDHQRKLAFGVSLPGAELPAELTGLGAHSDLKSFLEETEKSFEISRFSSSLDRDSYIEKIDCIQAHILEGDCYQVNFAQRFSADCDGDPLGGYLKLRRALPSPFSAYLPIGSQAALLSVSPERFLQMNAGGSVITSPIKGTSARHSDPQQDRASRERLIRSEKDRAENLMIVDLLRNDLSRTCHQVSVPVLFELQSFANVHHLVSTVSGRLKPGESALSLLKQAFPGGSITGAPKVRAMAIIESLETHRRGPYCGSIGYISACGSMDTNIAIRTLCADDGKLHCWGGGGIVADSEPAAEYEESLTKVRLLMQTLEDEFAGAP